MTASFWRRAAMLTVAVLVLAASTTRAAPPVKPSIDEKTLAQFRQWKAALPAEQQAWETTLEQNLGSFYLPLYQGDKVAGRVTAWDYVADQPGLPRVLLVGDSISRGYTLAVRKALAGKANVHRAPENCGGTANALKKLDIWLAGGHWDVIHFNFGIHDRRTPAAEYRQRLEKIVARLQQTGARLVWAATTPVADDVKDIRNADLVERNRIAAEVMAQHRIPVDDLYACILSDLAKLQNPHDCHFGAAGYDRLGHQVAKAIQAALPSAK
jgi:lysophospholipase L1-like esterase